LQNPPEVSQLHIGEIITGKCSITADTALRPAIFSGTDPQSWMNLQTHYGLTVAEENLSERLKKEEVRYAA
jgi:addiction module HigA family antidote